MFSMMAVISRPHFEAGDAVKQKGDVLSWKSYEAGHLPLERLRTNRSNHLYLVTVRPTTFAVWLVAIYERVTKRQGRWTSARRNETPIVDLSRIVGDLRFESGKGLRGPPALRPQVLQAPRVLTPGDLALIHGEMRKRGAAVPADPGDLADLLWTLEGKPVLKTHLTRERSASLRSAAREYWRSQQGSLRCIACQFSFGNRYGPAGEDFIELHHVLPLGSHTKAQRNTARDLIPLCSNCHRMIHRNLNAPMSLKELRTILRSRRRRKTLAKNVLPRMALARRR
jgi:HNH endonuclease